MLLLLARMLRAGETAAELLYLCWISLDWSFQVWRFHELVVMWLFKSACASIEDHGLQNSHGNSRAT